MKPLKTFAKIVMNAGYFLARSLHLRGRIILAACGQLKWIRPPAYQPDGPIFSAAHRDGSASSR